MDISKYIDAAAKFNITVTPTLLLIKKGKKDYMTVTSVAGSKTFKSNNLTRPQADNPMDNPNADSVTDSARNIRHRNRTEKSGAGGIQTTAGELTKDIAGLNKDVPPRSTPDYYRNQSFYHEGNLVEPLKQDGGIVLPSGMVIRGDAGYTPKNDEEFFRRSVFEKK